MQCCPVKKVAAMAVSARHQAYICNTVYSRLPGFAGSRVPHKLVLVVLQPHQLVDSDAGNRRVLDVDIVHLGGCVEFDAPRGVLDCPGAGPHCRLGAQELSRIPQGSLNLGCTSKKTPHRGQQQQPSSSSCSGQRAAAMQVDAVRPRSLCSAANWASPTALTYAQLQSGLLQFRHSS